MTSRHPHKNRRTLIGFSDPHSHETGGLLCMSTLVPLKVELPPGVAHVAEQSSGRWLSTPLEPVAGEANDGQRLVARELSLPPKGRRSLAIALRMVGGHERAPTVRAWAAMPQDAFWGATEATVSTIKVILTHEC
jgi:hypothetical protein